MKTELRYRIRRACLYAVLSLLTASLMVWAYVSGSDRQCRELAASHGVSASAYC